MVLEGYDRQRFVVTDLWQNGSSLLRGVLPQELQREAWPPSDTLTLFACEAIRAHMEFQQIVICGNP
jgi:hypothetical protein